MTCMPVVRCASDTSLVLLYSTCSHDLLSDPTWPFITPLSTSLIDTKNTGVKVQVFESKHEPSEYTKLTGKIFLRHSAHAGGLLRYLLRSTYHPRDDYTGPKGSGHC
ncbi:hypothetical protein HD554DRAFT_2105020 [Boletus coccyginus]|nr:hypothetical protein HD554DRAFT_2105020 [Boletus coccyginus]